MTDLGEWGRIDDPDSGGVAVAAAGGAGMMVDELVADEARREIREQVGAVVSSAVNTVLTPERLAAVQARAAAAAEAQLTAQPDPVHDQPPELYYGSVDEFVREMIVPVFRRRVGERATRRWAAEWWRSAEAIIRLEALWRSWEHLRLDPATGMSVWLRDHADHHLAMLFDPDGAFATSRDENRAGEPLPYTSPPDGLFPDARVERRTADDRPEPP